RRCCPRSRPGHRHRRGSWQPGPRGRPGCRWGRRQPPSPLPATDSPRAPFARSALLTALPAYVPLDPVGGPDARPAVVLAVELEGAFHGDPAHGALLLPTPVLVRVSGGHLVDFSLAAFGEVVEGLVPQAHRVAVVGVVALVAGGTAALDVLKPVLPVADAYQSVVEVPEVPAVDLRRPR